MLYGGRITVFTDHKPLTFAMSKVADPWSARQQRHLSYISQYTTNIHHITGKENVVADALSRASINALQEGINYEEMARDQRDDPEMQAYCTAITGLKLEDIPVGTSNLSLL